jgi:hypothetical protein
MRAIAIVENQGGAGAAAFRALSENFQATGHTPGEALDLLTSRSPEKFSDAPVFFQTLAPDEFFTKAQIDHLSNLMTRWRLAREKNTVLSPTELSELETLVDQEIVGATRRSALTEKEFEITWLHEHLKRANERTRKLNAASFVAGAGITLLLPSILMATMGSPVSGIITAIAGIIGCVLGFWFGRENSKAEPLFPSFDEDRLTGTKKEVSSTPTSERAQV